MINISELENAVKQAKSDIINNRGDKPDAIKVLGNNKPSFGELLNNENLKFIAGSLNFSKDVVVKMALKNIILTNLDKKKIMDGINSLEKKGANDALVILKDLSMIVNVKNKTVVSVEDCSNSNKLFTGIDSAVII